MFYDRFLTLCSRKGVSPSRAAIEAGISKSLVSKWKENSAKEPSPAVVRKLAEYFEISNYEVLEDMPTQKDGAAPLSEKEQRDIGREVNQIVDDLDSKGELMFDGIPMSEEDRLSLKSAMKVALGIVRQKNKETYTPKKYQEEKEP